MDELKLYGKNDEELEGLLSAVKAFSDNIGIEVGLNKCSNATFIGESSGNRQLDRDDIYNT